MMFPAVALVVAVLVAVPVAVEEDRAEADAEARFGGRQWRPRSSREEAFAKAIETKRPRLT
jgi:hypothetical protein